MAVRDYPDGRFAMLTASLVLLIAAFVLFAFAAAGVAAVGRVGLVPAGLAVWVLSQLLPLFVR